MIWWCLLATNTICSKNRSSLPASGEGSLGNTVTETDVVIHLQGILIVFNFNLLLITYWLSWYIYTDDGIRRVPSNAEDFDDRALWGWKIGMYARCSVRDCFLLN